MPYRKVVEMRKRAWELLELALKARDERAVEKILDDFTEGRISRREALERLRALVDGG